jgi:hypothetical protein
LELLLSEPLDPAAVNLDNIEMFEIFADATSSADTDPDVQAPGDDANPYYGDPVNYKVPIKVQLDQGLNAAGVVEVRIRVIPQIVLVDDTRYRLTFSGNILGLDFRQTFIGENGVTGDGQTPVDGGTQPFPEPGGLGYVTEFIVRDRPAISAVRTLTYDPLVDGINPEYGQSALSEEQHNSALYNPLNAPGTAVGFLSGFGDGQDGDFAVAGGNTSTIDTGDLPNTYIGNPFTVMDLNADDLHNPTSISPRPVTYDSPQYYELNLESLTISAGGTLHVIGVNPMLFRARGLVQIAGLLDAGGGDGAGNTTTTATGGQPGPAGGSGGSSRRGVGCASKGSACVSFAAFLSGCASAKNGGPFSDNGEGPGRGMAGGEVYAYNGNELTASGAGLTGTGGGGGSHATLGTAGQDIKNAAGTPGTPGPGCSTQGAGGTNYYWSKASSVIGVRGQPGPTYGDREVEFVLLGGSGGGAGGAQHGISSYASRLTAPGGAGGGGGGSVSIFAAGAIQVPGGVIDASGGDGGKGVIRNAYTWYSSWRQASGPGGGGSGGNVVLISGNDINMTAGVLDARGGIGGPGADTLHEPAKTTPNQTCTGCNTGGDGGRGFIFLMDADGIINGLIPGQVGEYDNFALGILTISGFNADRFSSIQAITELFGVGASDPEYIQMAPGDVLANVSKDQAVHVFASSAKGDLDEPLLPNPTTEMGAIEIALVTHAAGSVNVEIVGDMRGLNPTGAPERDAFTRIDARFDYADPVEAALGPFASIDQVDISFRFNG